MPVSGNQSLCQKYIQNFSLQSQKRSIFLKNKNRKKKSKLKKYLSRFSRTISHLKLFGFNPAGPATLWQRCEKLGEDFALLHTRQFLYQKLELEENLHNFGKQRIIITLVNCQIFVRKRRQKHDVLLVSGKKLTSKTQCCNNVGLWSKKGR